MTNILRHAVTLLALAAPAGCGGDGDSAAATGDGGTSAPAGSRIEGRITLPADATGRCSMVALDTDTTGSNGSAKRSDGSSLEVFSLVSGTKVDFAFEGVPVGTYFLWGYIDADGSASGPPDCEMAGGPTSGDHLGYYDTGLGPPGAANVAVPHADGSVFDFEIGVFP